MFEQEKPFSKTTLGLMLDSTLLFHGQYKGRGKKATVALDPFRLGEKEFEKLFFLADGIYPPWSRFVKTLPMAVGPKETFFSKWQESSRKDIERGFGQLQQALKSYQIQCIL